MSDYDDEIFIKNVSWRAVSDAASGKAVRPYEEGASYSGRFLSGRKYRGAQLENADFSSANLCETDFSSANLKGANFTAADLSGADLSNANLEGAVFSNALLRGTNFQGARMNGVILEGADIQDAFLLDVEMDRIALDELQALVEFLAIYYPHKLNLTRINLQLLNLSRIDLRAVSLRGVDLTGVDFTGVNIWELDLSECNITPEQIAQALGRPPTARELKQLLAPKKQRRAKNQGIDFSSFFDSRGTAGVWDLTKHPGISVATLLTMGKNIYEAVIKKPEPEDYEIMEKFQQSRAIVDDKDMARQQKEIKEIMEERDEKIKNQNKEPEMPDKNKQDEIVDDFDDAMEEDKRRSAVDITDYDYERRLKQDKENMIKEKREQYRENNQKIKDAAREMYAYSRSRGHRERG